MIYPHVIFIAGRLEGDRSHKNGRFKFVLVPRNLDDIRSKRCVPLSAGDGSDVRQNSDRKPGGVGMVCVTADQMVH